MRTLTKVACGIGLLSALAVPTSALATPASSSGPLALQHTQLAYYYGNGYYRYHHYRPYRYGYGYRYGYRCRPVCNRWGRCWRRCW
jgi:hypothetical protein